MVARPLSPEAWLERAATVRNGGTAAVERLVLERWGYAGRNPEIANLVRAMLLATPAEGYAACCDAIAKLDLEPELGSIRAPTLLIAGSVDPSASPAEAEKIAAVIPNARAAEIHGAAHLLNVEEPRAVTGLILDHLLGEAGRARGREAPAVVASFSLVDVINGTVTTPVADGVPSTNDLGWNA